MDGFLFYFSATVIVSNTVFEIFDVKKFHDLELIRFKVIWVKVHSANRKPTVGFLFDIL